MKRFTVVILLVALVGCSGEPSVPKNPPAPTPLTLEEWKTLPVSEKYDEGTYERLRMNDPKLKDERQWHDYMLKNIMPERDKDIPGRPGAASPPTK